MYCSNCGKEVNNNASFCPNCGNKMNINTMPVNNIPSTNYSYNVSNNYNNGYSYNNVNPSLKKNNTPLIIVLVVVIVGLLFSSTFLVFNTKNNISYDDDQQEDDGVLDSRTIMIYLCGSDLESRMGLASLDLESIDVDEVDLSTTNIVVYTGGSSRWFNYIKNNENAIYVLEETGFVKKENYNKQSMGSTNSLSTLFDYTYENYKADKYDLIMWNHGLGSLGISSDELFMSDYLSLNELSSALSKSKFTGNNKLETVVFRSCLNSTLEMASVFVPYANYFVASEEVTWGGNGIGVLSFLGDVTLEDSGVEFGKKFIAGYEASLDVLAKRYGKSFNEVFPVSTYAVIDLSKIRDLESKLGTFFNSINLDLNYNSIARVRSNLYQYASDSDCYEYDTVDLYQLVSKLKYLSSSNGESVLNVLDDAIVYNWSNNDFSKGLAIYFPYRSASSSRKSHYVGYKNLNGLSTYYSFIQRFDKLQSSSSGGGFSAISKDDIKISVNNKKLSLELYDEDVDNFTKASYIIFKKDSDKNYTPVFTSDTFELAKSNYTVDLDMDLIKVFNKDSNYGDFVPLSVNRFNNYYSNVELTDDKGTYTAKVYFDMGDDISISKVIMSSSESSTGMVLDLGDYKSMKFETGSYLMFRDNDLDPTWDKNPYTPNRVFVENNYKFERVSLDSNYYVMFKIYDVDNLYTYSDLIQIK